MRELSKKFIKIIQSFFFEVPLFSDFYIRYLPSRVVQLVTCLATDASLTADQGVASLILAWSHTFVEIDHE